MVLHSLPDRPVQPAALQHGDCFRSPMTAFCFIYGIFSSFRSNNARYNEDSACCRSGRDRAEKQPAQAPA